ncbi:MAG: uroporphyrinogen decarboxylase family protein, partial [Acidobacteriota bacterium]
MTEISSQRDSEARFLRACRRLPVDRTPVWFMRQAGRYMEEYRRLREKHSMLELCRQPELAAEVTLQPIRRFDLDAAIIFADILLPLPPMGVDFEFAAGEGPQIHSPLRTYEDAVRLRPIEAEESLGFVLEAIRRVRAVLSPEIALIGFAGAPFTLASYMIEGGHSRHFLLTKRLMYE